MINFILEIPTERIVKDTGSLFLRKPPRAMQWENESLEFVAWGDPVLACTLAEAKERIASPVDVVNTIRGHYYFLLRTKETGGLYAGNSLFSILPVYYCVTGESVVLSDNAFTLGSHTGNEGPCTRFVLETVLFGYPLFNSTLFNGISLLPSNSFLSVSEGRVIVHKHTAIEDLFEKDPLPWKGAVEETAESFLESVRHYLPGEGYASSLTGGFDGRTLVAAGLALKRKFSAYSFGAEGADDVGIASGLSAAAGIPFINITLNRDYVERESYGCGRDFVMNSSATATFARAHYLFAARRLSEGHDIIVTGNFGSEIFRAPHIAGSVISSNLITLFTEQDPGKAFKAIEESSEFMVLNRDSFRSDWESLKSDIISLPCYNPLYSGLTRNQRFYLFVFGEIFRKYFGAEMVNQFNYIRNRTPFLDIDFLRTIFRSRLAGIHSGFFDHNPFRRYKGQVLYAHIIKNSWPAFGRIPTDKGYAPEDLISFTGKARIALSYAGKRLKRQRHGSDPYAVKASWENNRQLWERIIIPGEYFDSGMLSSEQAGIELRSKVISLSSALSRSL